MEIFYENWPTLLLCTYPWSKSWEIRLHNFEPTLVKIAHLPQKENFWENPIFKSFWCSYNASLYKIKKYPQVGFWDIAVTDKPTYTHTYLHNVNTHTHITYILTNAKVSQLNNFEKAYLVFEEGSKNLFGYGNVIFHSWGC